MNEHWFLKHGYVQKYNVYIRKFAQNKLYNILYILQDTANSVQEILAIRFGDQRAAQYFGTKYHNIFPSVIPPQLPQSQPPQEKPNNNNTYGMHIYFIFICFHCF